MESRIIRICMGSSCFSRGNKDNLEIVQNFITNNVLDVEVHLTGNLCEKKCNIGPNLFIDDKSFNKVNKKEIIAILKKELLESVHVKT